MPRLNSFTSIGTKAYFARRRISELLYTITTDTTDVDISTLFSAEEWASSVKKKVVIDSGVTVGATSTSTGAITTGTGNGGNLEIVNNGTILGKGGSGGSIAYAPTEFASSDTITSNAGGNGGAGITAQVDCTIINNGNLYGGGGGGGSGGHGTTLRRYQTSYVTYTARCLSCHTNYDNIYCSLFGYPYVQCGTTIYTTVVGLAGGYGGAGGDGAGYGLATGASGSAGGSSSSRTSPTATSGAGGAGGAGGNYGSNGSSGSTGSDYTGSWIGSRYSYEAGGSFGFAGNSIDTGVNNVTVVNNGNMSGY